MSTEPILTRLVGVPIDCSGRFTGVERMPFALRAAGLVTRLGLPDEGDLPVTIDSPERDRSTGIIGFEAVCRSSRTVQTEIARLLRAGERPLVLGGCCTLLIGIGAALRVHYGQVGLAFVDGHLDCYTGQSSPTGEAADMELAILTGIGPAGLADLAGPPPMIAPIDVTVLGHRDPEETGSEAGLSCVANSNITRYGANAVRRNLPNRLGSATARLFEARPRRFWLHLDLDVLDEEMLPAVDYRSPGGLVWDEVSALIRPLTHSPALVGMDVTIYNPNLDSDGRYARQIVDLLTNVLMPRQD